MKNKTNLTLISTFIFVSCLFLSSAFVSAADFVEGTHYNELTTPINDNLNSTKEVREFFSFYCPACYRHEPIIGELKANRRTMVICFVNKATFYNIRSMET